MQDYSVYQLSTGVGVTCSPCFYKEETKKSLSHRGTLPYSPNIWLPMDKVWTLGLPPQKGKHTCLGKWWGEEMRGPLVLNCVF